MERSGRKNCTGAAAAGLALVLLLSGCEINTNKPITAGTSTFTNTSGNVNTGTGGGGGTTPVANTITISWNPNHETRVNAAGGGYRVSYSLVSPVPAGAPYVNVPYVSGALAPTSTDIAGLASGTYYLVVVAFSAQNASGSASAQISVVIQ